VDGAFLKSWYISHERANAARRFLDPQVPGVMPLNFAGLDQRFPVQPGEVCEAWWGPAGDQIYFVHPQDEERWYGFAGGDLLGRQRRATAGRAYIMLGSANPYWLATSLKSFVGFFPYARLFCATFIPNCTGPVIDKLTPERQASEVEAQELAWVRSHDAQLHAVQIEQREEFSRRFLAKVGLGLGANLFGDDYIQSPYAAELREAMWEQTRPDETSGVRGTDLMQEIGLQNTRLNGLRGVWSIMMKTYPNTFALLITTPSGRSMTLQLSDDPRFWSSERFRPYHDGAFYFVVPERSIFSDPVGLLDFVGHQNGRRPNPIMTGLEALQVTPSQLPPMR
jgi:hypothetical protein